MNESVKLKFRYNEKVTWNTGRTGVIVEWSIDVATKEVTYLVRADDDGPIKYVAVKEEHLARVE